MDTIYLFIYFYVVLRIKPSASHVLDKCSITKLLLQPLALVFEMRFNYVVQAGLELEIFLI